MELATFYHKFLRAKHWHLFILSFGLPFFIAITGVIAIMLTLFLSGGFYQGYSLFLNERILFIYFGVVILLSFIGSLVFAGWIISVGFGLKKYIPEELRLKTGWFKASILSYLILPLILIIFLITSIRVPTNSVMFGLSIFLLIPFKFFMFAAYIYILYFTGRTFKTAQLQEKLTLGDYIGEILMIYLFPVGVWFIQPEINKILKRSENITES